MSPGSPNLAALLLAQREGDQDGGPGSPDPRIAGVALNIHTRMYANRRRSIHTPRALRGSPPRPITKVPFDALRALNGSFSALNAPNDPFRA
ncbi:hypothetical protein GCM10022247_19690 [Allokutzneria multivorans]|uniref:Uncharacterized protein n=1 Tax=Allokutzneria multivorans TaxID=1142134 RepID=A0ABP7RM50_9PSEU